MLEYILVGIAANLISLILFTIYTIILLRINKLNLLEIIELREFLLDNVSKNNTVFQRFLILIPFYNFYQLIVYIISSLAFRNKGLDSLNYMACVLKTVYSLSLGKTNDNNR